MQNIFDNMGGALDANDPEEKIIIEQRRIRKAWYAMLHSQQPAAIFSDDQQLEINTGVILSAHRIYENEVAKYATGNHLLRAVADNLRHAYDRRGFSFPRSQASAIADPDQLNDEARMLFFGILLWGESAYDLRVPLLLTKKDDGKEFDFFFALKLATLDAVDCDTFLEHQLKVNFDSKIEKFCHYLKALLRQFESDEVLKLGAGTVETIREWIMMKLPSTSEPARIECVKINGSLTDRHFNAFLDHLESVLNSGSESKITKLDTELLKAHGLAVPVGKNPLR